MSRRKWSQTKRLWSEVWSDNQQYMIPPSLPPKGVGQIRAYISDDTLKVFYIKNRRYK